MTENAIRRISRLEMIQTRCCGWPSVSVSGISGRCPHFWPDVIWNVLSAKAREQDGGTLRDRRERRLPLMIVERDRYSMISRPPAHWNEPVRDLPVDGPESGGEPWKHRDGNSGHPLSTGSSSSALYIAMIPRFGSIGNDPASSTQHRYRSTELGTALVGFQG